MDKVAAKEASTVKAPHKEEPYNENKPLNVSTIMQPVNSYFTSWFAGTAAAPPQRAECTSTNHPPMETTATHSTMPPRSNDSTSAAADIAGTESIASQSKPQKSSKIAAKLEAMRRK